MKNYAVLADLGVKTALHIEKAYDKGYDQGYNDCKVELLEDEAKCHYQEGYNDGYRKGAERGKETRVAEADCAYQCGMKRAWEVARKIVLSPKEGGLEATTEREIFGMPYESALMKYSAKNAIEMIEAWEKKQKQEQEQSKKRCENCDHYCGYDDKFKCDIKGVLCIERDRWTSKQKQVEKSCKTCSHTETGMPKNDDAQCEECHFDGSGNTLWQPKEKQDAPETNVGSIEVGDEVRMIGSDPKLDNCDFGVCTMVKPKTIYVMRMDGSVGEEDKEEWEKTGNHYDIQSILDKMKENEVKKC